MWLPKAGKVCNAVDGLLQGCWECLPMPKSAAEYSERLRKGNGASAARQGHSAQQPQHTKLEPTGPPHFAISPPQPPGEHGVSSGTCGPRERTATMAATAPAAAAAAEGTPRLMIREMVLENFKSYAGAQRVGPFHKVGPATRPARRRHRPRRPDSWCLAARCTVGLHRNGLVPHAVLLPPAACITQPLTLPLLRRASPLWWAPTAAASPT